MGLGKTVQTLAAVELLARERGIARVLVVAPASVKYQWETEIRKFTDRAVQVIDGGTEQRQAQYAQPTFYRLVNYEQVVRDLDAINAWQPDLVVLDEAQRIKNWESKTSRAVKKLRSRYAMVLTGTPLENKLEELYSIVQFVDDRRLGPAFQFLHDHRVLDAEGQPRSATATSTRSARSWRRSSSAARGPTCSAQLPGADRQHRLRRDEPTSSAAPYDEQQASARPAAGKDVPDRPGPQADSRAASPTCGCSATARSCSTSRRTSRRSSTSSPSWCRNC